MARKNTYNKVTPQEIRSAIQKMCAGEDYDPFLELIKLAKETYPMVVDGQTVHLPVCDVNQRITIAKELAAYLAPKIKSLEISGSVDNKLEIEVTMVGGETKAIEAGGADRQGDITQRVLQGQVKQIQDRTKDILGDAIVKEVEEVKVGTDEVEDDNED